MDRPITKETVAFGVGGQLVLDDGFPELPPKARVTLTLDADFDNIKHKFLDKGGVEETLILTIDTATVVVVKVSEPEPEPEQTSLEEGDGSEE